MMKRALTLALAATFAAGLSAQTSSQKPTPAPAAAAKSKTMQMAQGSWVFMTADGQDVSGSGQEIVITITDDKYVQLVNGAIAERGSFKLDESKKPMWIDIKITEGDDAGRSQIGVIELTATSMRGKISMPDGTTRPTDFEPADGFFVFTARKK